MSADESTLRAFYEIIGATGAPRPSWEVWKEHASDNAELWPIQREGKMIGGVLFKGHTVHIAILPEWHGRWITKAMLRAWRQFDHGVNLYATPTSDSARVLAERLGFVLCKDDDPGVGILWRVVSPNHKTYVKERNPCLQP